MWKEFKPSIGNHCEGEIYFTARFINRLFREDSTHLGSYKEIYVMFRRETHKQSGLTEYEFYNTSVSLLFFINFFWLISSLFYSHLKLADHLNQHNGLFYFLHRGIKRAITHHMNMTQLKKEIAPKS